MIEISGLELVSRSFSLGPLSLGIEAGAHCVLLGPSGAGKSSLLEWVAGFRHAKRGDLRIGGKEMIGVSPGRRDTALVFQEAALFPHLTVRDNIAFPLRVRGSPRSERDKRAADVADLFQIAHRLDAFPRTLSGGEARRVALARAVARPRSVLLLDEPLSGVDRRMHRDLVLLLRTIQRELKLTVLHVTHSVFEARNLATHLGVLIDGNLRQFGTATGVFARPADIDVARTLAVSNLLVGKVCQSEGCFLSSDGVQLSLDRTTGEGTRARLRNIRFTHAPDESTRQGRVVTVEVSALGQKTARVVLKDTDVELALPVTDESALAVGATVWIDWNSVEAELY